MTDKAIPNIEYLGACYDIVTMDPLNLAKTALPQTVFSLSQSSGVKTSIGSYDVPTGVQWRKILKTGYESLSGVISSTHDFQESLRRSLKVNAGVKGGFEFSGSESFTNIKGETQSRKRSFAYARAVAEIHFAYVDIADRKSGLKLSPSFLDAVARLPNNPDEVESPTWTKFVERFGTHFTSAVTLGGMATQRTSGLATRFLKSDETKRELEGKAKVVIDKLKAGASAEEAQASVRSTDSDDKLERSILDFQGGVGSMEGVNDKWIASLSGDPTLISAQFQKITELLTDHFFPNDPAIWFKHEFLEFTIKEWIRENGEPACFTAPLEYGESLLPMTTWTDGKTLRPPIVDPEGDGSYHLSYIVKNGKPLVESPQPANIVLENASGSRGKRPVLAGDEVFLKHAPTGNYLSGSYWRPNKSQTDRFVILHAGDDPKSPTRIGAYFNEGDSIAFAAAPLGRDGWLMPHTIGGRLQLAGRATSFRLIRWDPNVLDEDDDDNEE
jgi:hypothetical protein